MKSKHVLLSLLCCMIWFAAFSTESEPNNDRAHANTLTLNGSNKGAINPAGDVDWWKVTTTSDGQLNITWTAKGGHYTYAYLYDNDGTTLLASTFTAGTATIFYDGLQPGTYYVQMYCYTATDTSNYSISNSLTVAALTNDVEPDGLYTQANTMTLNGSITGHVGFYYNHVRDTVDWYKFTTTGDGLVNLQLAVSNGQYVYWYLYDGNGTTYLNGTYTAGTFNYNTDGLAAGTYYVKIYSYSTSGFAPYTLTNTFTAPTQANDVEPNGTPAQAKILPLNGKKTGHIDYYYNVHRDSVDWYKFTTTGDGRVKLTLAVANGQYVYWQLYDNNATTQLNISYTAGTASYNTDGLAAGTYYVKIFAYSTNGFAPYTLSDSLFTPAQANDIEPNGTTAQAINFSLNSTVTGHIGYYYNLKRDTIDWYKLVTTQDGMIGLSFTSNNGQYAYWQLYDNDGTTQLNSSYTAGTASYNTDGLAAGTYYVKVFAYSTNGFAPYTLTNTFTTYTNANDGLSNDFAKLGNTLPANGTKQGHVGFRNNGGSRDLIDWWKINYTGTGALTVTLNWEAFLNGTGIPYVYLQIYKDTAGAVLSNTYSASGNLTANLTGLTQGYYYVAVLMYTNYQWTAYNLTPTFTQTNCVTSVSATTTHVGTSCTNSYITFKVTGGLNQQVQLYRYGVQQGGKVFVDGTGSHKFDNLAPGSYTCVGLNDGATGSCMATSAIATVVPKPTGLNATNVTSTTADVNWTTFTCEKYYTVQYRPLGATTWKKKTTVGNVGTYHLTGLTKDTTYEYHVAGNDSANGIVAAGKYSAIFTFGTLPKLGDATSADEVNFNVYPNPASSNVHVSFENGTEGEVMIRLFDVNGKTVFVQHQNEASGNVNEEIDLSGLNTGVYQLQIITADGSVMNQSIVKTKE